MSAIRQSVLPELMKIRHSPIVRITFAAFAMGPLMGGLALFLLDSSDTTQSSSMLAEKARMMAFSADWNSYFTILSQVVGVGGVVIFGFVASWLFGREYSDRTAKDLLALPTSRSGIVNAKFAVYVLWCTALILSNLLLGLLIGWGLGIRGFEWQMMAPGLQTYFLTALMVIALGTPVACVGIWGRGYLAPIGWVVLALVLAQIIAAVGFGPYFPWSVPGLFSGISREMKASVDVWSFLSVALVAMAGYWATHRAVRAPHS